MQATGETQKYLKWTVCLCSFAIGIMSFVLPIYTKGLGGNALEIGGLFSVFSLVTTLLRPVVGRCIDRFGRKYIYLASLLIYSAAMLFYSFAGSLLMLYTGRIINAIGASCLWVTAYSIATDISDNENRGATIGKMDGASSKGALLGAVLGFSLLSWVSFRFGWSILFKGYALLCITAAFIVWRFIPETIPRKDSPQNEKERQHPVSANYLRLMIVVFIGSVSSSMLSPLLMIYLQDHFTTAVGKLATAYIPAALVFAFLSPALGRLSDRYGRVKPIIIGTICSGLISVGFIYCNRLELLSLMWALESVGVAAASPAEESLVADLAGDDIRGRAYGGYLMVAGLGSTIGPLLGGWLYDRTLHTVPFYLNAAILIMDALLAFVLFRHYRAPVKAENNA